MTKPLSKEQKESNRLNPYRLGKQQRQSPAQKSYDSEAKKNEKLLDKAKETPSQRTARLSKLAEEIAGRGGHVDGNGNLVMPLGSAGPQKLTGFDGSQLKATTPFAVQQAANAYFDRKSDVELAKDKMVFALGRIEAEMKAANVEVCTVRSMAGEAMTCRISTSSKLVIKRLK